MSEKKIFIIFNMNNFNILHRKTLKKCTLNTGLKCGHYTVLSGSFFKIQKDNMQNNECISCGIFFSVSHSLNTLVEKFVLKM